jgi:hypothetical protein
VGFGGFLVGFILELKWAGAVALSRDAHLSRKVRGEDGVPGVKGFGGKGVEGIGEVRASGSFDCALRSG